MKNGKEQENSEKVKIKNMMTEALQKHLFELDPTVAMWVDVAFANWKKTEPKKF
ncbi:MAG: hypothetical protein LBB13_02780 [Rickettsiales bacterium]|jgi:hypothetical protein|nr:hypothetical protein [Rickettsiales bacterium]